MNTFEFVLAVLILVFAFTIVRHKLGIPDRSARDLRRGTPVENAESEQLRAQVRHLQERIRVLERIVTDSGVQTASQIEALRDREPLEEEDKA